MKKALIKSTLRDLRLSAGRFFAILAIVGLGVGFFAGLRITGRAMIKTTDGYLRDLNFYDFRLISSYGFTPEDISAFSSADGISYAEGGFFCDMLANIGGEDTVAKVMSLPEKINLPALTAGRMPKTDGECLLDSRFGGEELLGKEIVFEPPDGDPPLSADRYIITGLCCSPLYLNYERGNTSLGNGRIGCFVYIPSGAFTAEYFGEAYITMRDSGEIYSSEYSAAADKIKPYVEKLLAERAERRFSDIKAEADEKIASYTADYEKGLSDYNGAKAEAERQLSAAQSRLSAAKEEIASGKAAIASAKAELEKASAEKYAELKAKLSSAGVPAVEGSPAFDAAAAEIEKALSIERAAIAEKEKALKQAEDELSRGQSEYNEQKSANEEELSKAKEKLDSAKADIDEAKADLLSLEPPETFILTRDDNVGYICFNNDSDIVNGIAKIFPLFFFLVAALVCSTTMGRMIGDERTRIGVLKALGYGNGAISGKYLFYSGFSGVTGCIAGFFLGTKLIPFVLWKVYDIMYGFPRDIVYVFSPGLFFLGLAAALICTGGVTLGCCRGSLAAPAAALLRPRAPAAGKKALIERVGVIFNRLGLLGRVSVRNIFRYKKRMAMMILGISGCTALLLTGFGIRDSISDILSLQYDEITTYDMTVNFTAAPDDDEKSALASALPEGSNICFISESSAEVSAGAGTKTANLISSSGEECGGFINYKDRNEPVDPPKAGQALLNRKLGETIGAAAGDEITLRYDGKEIKLKVAALVDNYIYNYIFVNEESFSSPPERRTAYIILPDGADASAAETAALSQSGVAAVTMTATMRERVNSMFKSLDYIVLLVVVCAGALALTVIYNLTNINISERTREIATLRVLGFTRRETDDYIFRENNLLTAAGALLGLPLGVLLTDFVMSRINVDLVTFRVSVAWQSFLYALLITVVFSRLVNLLLRRKIRAVDMVESLKSAE